jgi:hypothetical protein
MGLAAYHLVRTAVKVRATHAGEHALPLHRLSGQIPRYEAKLRQRRLQLLDDLLRDDFGGGRLSESDRLSSRSQKMSRLAL